jgi:hypothetical protein
MTVSGSFTTLIGGVRHTRAGTESPQSSSFQKCMQSLGFTRHAGGL